MPVEDAQWLREARRRAASCCIVMQGLLAYLPADAVYRLFATIAEAFDRATLLVDLPNSWQHGAAAELAPLLQRHGRGWDIADVASPRLVRLTAR
jgi:O-methyltransferase involved in polyketide biosynthesis